MAKHTGNPLGKKFISSLRELDSIEDPAIKALARRAVSRYYGVFELSGPITAGSWAMLIIWLPISILWLGVAYGIFSEVILFLICAGVLGFAMVHDGYLTESGFISYWKSCIAAMCKYLGIFGKGVE